MTDAWVVIAPTAAVTAAACAAGAAGATRLPRAIRRGAPPRPGVDLPWWRRTEHHAPPLAPVERAGVAAAAGLVVLRPTMAAVVLVGAFAAVLVARAQARRASVHASRAAVRAGIGAVAAALRAGLPPLAAWGVAAGDAVSGEGSRARTAQEALFGPVAAAARLGLDVSAALDEAALRPGADALRVVAVCWRVTEGAGSGLAGALERLVEGLREDEELSGIVHAELASARATGRLLAALPIVGVAGAAALGTPPRELLLDTAVGRVCTLAAVTLELCGLLWLRRLAASVG